MVRAEAVAQVHPPGLGQGGSLQADLVTFLETIHIISFRLEMCVRSWSQLMIAMCYL